MKDNGILCVIPFENLNFIRLQLQKWSLTCKRADDLFYMLELGNVYFISGFSEKDLV
jgi:hypothetical protein